VQVVALLEKLQPDMITIDNNLIGTTPAVQPLVFNPQKI